MLVVILAWSPMAWAQTGGSQAGGSQQVASQKAVDEKLEASPIGGESGESGSGKDAPAGLSPQAFDATRVVLALGGVIGLILVLRAGAKRFFPSAVVSSGLGAVKVIGRCAISPRQQLVVVQFGKRLVLVGDGGSILHPLCEISDPDEAAAIVAQSREETISLSRRFESIFGRARKDYNEDESAEGASGVGTLGPEEGRKESFDETSEIPGGDGGQVRSVDEAQKELAELHEKVREVARKMASA
jgi:flagellar biogenesis protein FliO